MIATYAILMVPVYMIGVIVAEEFTRGDRARMQRAVATWTLAWGSTFLLWFARVIVLIWTGN